MATNDLLDFLDDSFNKYTSVSQPVSTPTSPQINSSFTKRMSISEPAPSPSATPSPIDYPSPKKEVEKNITVPTLSFELDDTNGLSDDDDKEKGQLSPKAHIEENELDEMLRLVNDSLSKLKTSAMETTRLIEEREAKLDAKAAPRVNANPSLYKTALCKRYTETNNCSYGKRCWFAHGIDELRDLPPKKSDTSTPSRTKSVNSPSTRYLISKNEEALKSTNWRN